MGSHLNWQLGSGRMDYMREVQCSVKKEEEMMMYINEGATHHLVKDVTLFNNSVEINPPRCIRVDNKKYMHRTRKGVVHFVVEGKEGGKRVLALRNVFFSSDASVCLYSVCARAMCFGWGSYMDDD